MVCDKHVRYRHCTKPQQAVETSAATLKESFRRYSRKIAITHKHRKRYIQMVMRIIAY